MMIDKLVVSVTGSFGPARDAEDAGRVFRHYRDLLLSRVQPGAGEWKAPSTRSDVRFTMRTRGEHASTISGATLSVAWAPTGVDLRLTATVNPTRTFRHLLQAQAEQTASQLRQLAPERFFRAGQSVHEVGLDGNDNLIPDIDAAKTQMGEDYGSAFMAIFEQQLRRWMLDAAAPRSEGFEHDPNPEVLAAVLNNQRLELRWPQVTVSSAEVYFERRHADAKVLMDRVARHSTANHAEADLRRYEEKQLGGRRYGSAVVGIGLTERIEQVFYAKSSNRIRAETRYVKGLRNILRAVARHSDPYPLATLLNEARADAAKRTRWDVFCDYCEEPRRAMLHEVATMMAIIAECAKAVNIDPEPVFRALLGSGGIDETAKEGQAPHKLMRHLASAGLIDTRSLKQRLQPGETRRHGLTGEWLQIANRLQEAFGTDLLNE